MKNMRVLCYAILVSIFIVGCGASNSDDKEKQNDGLIQMEEGKEYIVQQGWVVTKTSSPTRLKLTEIKSTGERVIVLLSGSASIQK